MRIVCITDTEDDKRKIKEYFDILIYLLAYLPQIQYNRF